MIILLEIRYDCERQKCYFYGVTITSGHEDMTTCHVTMENVIKRKFKVFEVEYEILHELDRIFKNILKTKNPVSVV